MKRESALSKKKTLMWAISLQAKNGALQLRLTEFVSCYQIFSFVLNISKDLCYKIHETKREISSPKVLFIAPVYWGKKKKTILPKRLQDYTKYNKK